jgi:hypothetical protein
MTLTAARYDRWKAPAADGELLLWPAVDQLLRDTQENSDRLRNATSARIQNIPLAQVRRRLRSWLGHSDESPIIGTGHQTELYHAGVWAKDVLIEVVAAKLNGKAIHFAVDTDEPKHLQLRCPRGSVPLLDTPNTDARWTALLPAPTPAHLAEIEQKLAKASENWQFQSLLGPFLSNMKRQAMGDVNLPTALTDSLHELDWSLGLRHHAMLASPIWISQPYLVFVHHVLARIDAFSQDYNAALGAYRAENKIRSIGRPMPDLSCTADGCEAPFWLDSLSDGTRRRAAVRLDGAGRFALESPSGDSFVLDPTADGWDAAERLHRWLVSHQLRLSPRALTLTAVLRLLVADQFVHGIGGGQYDQVLDGLISRHFAIDPPRFSVTTATLFFPDAARQSRVCLPCVAMEGRKLKNSVLGEEKHRMVEVIESLPRHSLQRAELFLAMRDKLAQAWKGDAVRRWEAHYAEAERRSIDEKTLFDRELFYAIQSTSRLTGLIDRYRGQFATP